MRSYLIVLALLFVIISYGQAGAITAPSNISVNNVGAQTVGSTTFYSSTQLSVSWTPPSDATAHHYVISATESIKNTSVSVSSSSTSATLNGLKAATAYSVNVRACADSSCINGATSSSVTGTTSSEYWQLQGSGNTVTGLTRIVSDGNARISATRIGPDAGGETASRLQLYYGPTLQASPGGGEKPKLVAATTSLATDASVLSSYLSFQSFASSSGILTPSSASTLVESVATGQGVPISSSMGGKIRLFFEAQGSDSKTRIMYLDSQDGYTGKDFNSGSATTCSTASDYQAGGGCAPSVVIGVEGDSLLPNSKIKNARQFKLGFPILNDWRWDGAVGTFMVFTTDQVTGCSTSGMNHGYAVWSGSKWDVQYESGGCPKLFKSAQAAFPMHLGGTTYKMYYGDPSITTGKLSSSMPFLGPKKLIYSDGSSTGSADLVDFEDWEAQDSARDVIFMWPNGEQLNAGAEGYIDDYHFLAPTGDLGLQVMYMAITEGNLVPIAAAAVLLNPGQSTTEDTTAPVITSFSVPQTSSGLTVQISSLSATDKTGVTGYLLTESNYVPLISDPDWSASVPSSFTFSSTGAKSLYAWAKDSAGNISRTSSADITINSLTPVPSIKANSTSGQITVDQNTPVSVGITLDPGNTTGQNMDWWIVVSTPFGLYSYVANSGWNQGLNLAYQGSIFGLSEALEVVNTALPPGDYTFYFGVDSIPNGTVDIPSLYYSSVNVHVDTATAGTSMSDLTFYPDPGFRKGYGTTNPMAGLSPNNLLYLYYNDEGLLQNTSGSKLATSTDGISFTDGVYPTTYLYHPKYVLMPDGITRRTYMPAGNETARVISDFITTGSTRTNDPGERYNGASIDNGAIGIVEVFPDNIGGYVMLYIGDKFNTNNIRRAYSPPGDNGMNFTFTTPDILGDASRAAGSDRNVDQFSILLPDNRRRLFTMAYGGSRIDSYISSDYGTTFIQETGSRLTTSDFTEYRVYSLHDPCVVRLSDGKYRMYVCARVDYDTSAAEGSNNRYKFVIVSATTI